MTYRALALAFGILVAATAAVAQDAAPEPIAVEPNGILPIENESRVQVEGVSGEVILQLGKSREVRFSSRRSGPGKEGLPVSVYSEHGTLVFRPPAGETGSTSRQLYLALPAEIETVIRTDQATVSGSGLKGGLDIEGKKLSVELRGLSGSVTAAVEGGAVTVGGMDGLVTIRGSNLKVNAVDLAGDLSLALKGGSVAVESLAGGLEADLDSLGATVHGVGGTVRIHSRSGSLELTGARSGGELQLTQVPVRLRECRGDLTVSTDGDAQFTDMESSLHFDSYGGSLRGVGNKGLLEIRTRSAEVTLERNIGPVGIQGDGLKISVKDVSGETMVFAGTSDVKLEGINGKLTIEDEGGDVSVRRATQDVHVKHSRGDLSLLDLNGPLDLETDAPQAEVSWASITGDKDSSLKNASGNLRVTFPNNGSCHVEAKSQYGRVESSLSRVRVQDDGRSASGPVNNGNRPSIKIEASGDIELIGPGGQN